MVIENKIRGFEIGALKEIVDLWNKLWSKKPEK
jgi:hypothetical protein